MHSRRIFTYPAADSSTPFVLSGRTNSAQNDTLENQRLLRTTKPSVCSRASCIQKRCSLVITIIIALCLVFPLPLMLTIIMVLIVCVALIAVIIVSILRLVHRSLLSFQRFLLISQLRKLIPELRFLLTHRV